MRWHTSVCMCIYTVQVHMHVLDILYQGDMLWQNTKILLVLSNSCWKTSQNMRKFGVTAEKVFNQRYSDDNVVQGVCAFLKNYIDKHYEIDWVKVEIKSIKSKINNINVEFLNGVYLKTLNMYLLKVMEYYGNQKELFTPQIVIKFK